MTNPSCQIAPNPIPLLIQLPDVDITGIVTGNTLVYNTVTKKWTAGSGGGGGGTVTSVGVSSTDLSVSGSPVTTTGTITLNINSNAVTFAKIQQIATSRLLGRSTAGTGNVEELTIGSGLSLAGGVLSASGSGTVTSVGVSSTDLSVSGSPVTTTGTISLNINSNAVTFAKIQQIATSRLLGRSTAGTGNVEELTIGSGLSLAGGVLSASGGGYSAPTLGTTSIASGATVTTINGLTLTTTTMTASSNVLGGVTMTLGSDQNGDMYFRQGGVLTRVQLGAAGSFLKSLGGIPSSTAPYSVSSQSVDYTLVLADASSVLYLTGSVAKSFTVPPNSTAAFAIGTVITFYQDGTGALTIVAGAGVTIRSEYGLILNTQYSVATITKIATDTWILGGSLRVS